MQNVDLNDLINRPGAGVASQVLKETGHWDEDAGRDAVGWVVTVDYTITETEVIHVTARSEEEADEAAYAILEEKYDFNTFSIYQTRRESDA